MFISKRKHDAIVKELLSRVDLHKTYEEMRRDNQKNNDSLVKLLDKITDKNDYLTANNFSAVTMSAGGGYELSLPDNVPVYVEDYFGGKVIKQEATPVTILDEKGKATYGLTKQAPDKGKIYKLVEKAKEF